jgi:hypothetical protein
MLYARKRRPDGIQCGKARHLTLCRITTIPGQLDEQQDIDTDSGQHEKLRACMRVESLESHTGWQHQKIDRHQFHHTASDCQTPAPVIGKHGNQWDIDSAQVGHCEESRGEPHQQCDQHTTSDKRNQPTIRLFAPA